MADGAVMAARGRRWLAGVALLALAGTGAACGGDDEDTADFCEKYRSFEDQSEQAGQDLQENPEDVDLEEIKSVFREVADQIEELEAEAPDDIRDDVATISEAASQFADEIDQAEDPEQMAEVIAGQAEGADEAEEAGGRVDDWIEDNCDSDGAK